MRFNNKEVLSKMGYVIICEPQNKLREIKISEEDSVLSTKVFIDSIQRFIVSSEEIVPIFILTEIDVTIFNIVFELSSLGRHQIRNHLAAERGLVICFVAQLDSGCFGPAV